MTTATIESSRIPRIALQSVAGGLVLMAFFTGMWGTWAMPGLMPGIGAAVGIAFVLVAVVFVAEAIRLLWAARRYPTQVRQTRVRDRDGSDADSAQSSGPRASSGRWFGIIFGAEGLVIFIVCAILGSTGNTDFINPAIALIVGVHFIPLAWVFRRSVDYYVAAWFVLTALAGMVAIASAALPVALVWSLVAIAAACGTSFYGFYMISVKRSMLASR